MALALTRKAELSLASQACIVREQYPELFSYLRERDLRLRRALKRVPSRADIELSATFNYRTHLSRAIDDYATGIGELAGE